MICDAGPLLFLYHVLFFAAPLGLPLIGLAYLALRRSWRWPAVGLAVLSVVLLATTFSARHLIPESARWVPLTFAIPAAFGAASAVLATRGSRIAALAAALVPPCAMIGVSLAWNLPGCP